MSREQKQLFYVAPEVLGVTQLVARHLLQASSAQDVEDGEITATPSDFE